MTESATRVVRYLIRTVASPLRALYRYHRQGPRADRRIGCAPGAFPGPPLSACESVNFSKSKEVKHFDLPITDTRLEVTAIKPVSTPNPHSTGFTAASIPLPSAKRAVDTTHTQITGEPREIPTRMTYFGLWFLTTAAIKAFLVGHRRARLPLRKGHVGMAGCNWRALRGNE